MFVFCNPCARAELRRQKRARNLSSGNSWFNEKTVNLVLLASIVTGESRRVICFYSSYDKLCGKLALGLNFTKTLSNSVAIFWRFQTDVHLIPSLDVNPRKWGRLHREAFFSVIFFARFPCPTVPSRLSQPASQGQGGWVGCVVNDCLWLSWLIGWLTVYYK